MEERIREYLENVPEDAVMRYWWPLDLSGLGLTEIPELPESISSIYIGGNKFTDLPEIPSNIKCVYIPNSNIKKLPKIPSHLEYLNLNGNLLSELPEIPYSLKFLDIRYNNITSLPKSLSNLDHLIASDNNITKFSSTTDSSDLFIDLENNPLVDVDINKGNIKINVKNTPFNNSVQFVEQKFKSFKYNHKKYEYITIKKGTVLFRRSSTVSKINESIIGFRKGDNYFYPPQHTLYFSMYPTYNNDSVFGDIQTIWKVKEDINLLAMDFIEYPEELREKCHTFDSDIDQGSCLNKKIIDSYNIKGRFLKQDSDIIDFRHGFNGKGVHLSQDISFYPRKVYENKDIITPVKDYNLNWLVNHLNEFIVEPMIIMKNNDVLDKLFSKKGYKHVDGITYKIILKDYGYSFETI